MQNIKFISGIVIIAWILAIVDQFTPLNLNALGVMPRELHSLLTLPFMPFLHGSWGHLINNTISFLLLGVIASTLTPKTFKEITMWIIMLSSFGTWLIGQSNSVHIGMSALIFGYFGYTLSVCWFSRNWATLAFGAIVLYTQSGMFAGMLPFTTPDKVSWEGHLSGAIAGATVGYFYCKSSVKTLTKET